MFVSYLLLLLLLLLQGNTRLYLLNMYPPHARRILCAVSSNSDIVKPLTSTFPPPSPPSLSLSQAYRADSEMKYPRYVWLVFGWYPNEWWTESM